MERSSPARLSPVRSSPARSSPVYSSLPRPRFRLSFRIIHDGQDTIEAQALTRAGAHAHGGAFPFFPRLPPELRHNIWDFLLAPRLIAVSCIDEENPRRDDEELRSFPDLQHPLPRTVPVLLLVNREARSIALRRYEPAFAWKIPYVFVSNSPSYGHGVGAAAASAAAWSPPSVWFDYARDALYLIGELEPCDTFGFNSPMTYFLRREDARRVRRLVIAFGALGYGEAGSQHIFGALFHVVDRFTGVEGKVFVSVVPRDEFTHTLIGGEGPLVRSQEEARSGGGESSASASAVPRHELRDEGNVVQRVWTDWYNSTAALASMHFKLVWERDLPDHIAQPRRDWFSH
ncbi:hypothetical protein F5Y11DRAFT_319551 [Daldinia sp. FL1419]|nr:hypothetical protein F5Y11DRAFT_319551 [Daldinia sp. FL1419]